MKSNFLLIIKFSVLSHKINLHVTAFVRKVYTINVLFLLFILLPDVQVYQINTGLDILYQDADDLSITVNSYVSIFMKYNEPFDHILITFSQSIIVIFMIFKSPKAMALPLNHQDSV